MQADGVIRGDGAVPRRRRLNALLAIVAIVAIAVIAAMLVLVVWAAPLATNGVGADDARQNAGAGSAIVHDDAGNVNAGAGAVVQAGGQASEVNVQADHRDAPALHPHPRGLP